ncbi:hypothetical protein Tco_0247245 [Tanacetum coccineum]
MIVTEDPEPISLLGDLNIKSPKYIIKLKTVQLEFAEDNSASVLQVLRRSSSIFTLVYVAVQKLKKALARASLLQQRIELYAFYFVVIQSTDKAKTTRKRLKLGKHEHKNERACKKPEVFYKKIKKSSLGQLLVNQRARGTIQVVKYTWAESCIIKRTSLVNTHKKGHVGRRKAQVKMGFTLNSLTKLTQVSQSRIATLLNGRRAYNGRAPMDFYWLISDKPELLISSFEHFSFCLAEALFKLNGMRAYNGRAPMDFYWLISDKPELLISSFEHFSFCLAEALVRYI